MTARSPLGFPLCVWCADDRIACVLVGTHAPLCTDCAAGIDWSHSPGGAPPDVAAVIEAITGAPNSQATMQRYGQQLLLAQARAGAPR